MPGSFAEQVAVPRADFNLVRLPAEIDFVSAAVLGCRFATAFHALTGAGAGAAGEWVAVFGCGGVGLSAVMIAAALGARVIAVDPSPAAWPGASDLGAETHRVATTRSTGVADDHRRRGARRHRRLGSAATADAAVRSLRRRGRHLQVGLMVGDDRRRCPGISWSPANCRSWGHGMAAADYPPMLAMIADGRLQSASAARCVDPAGAGRRSADGDGSAERRRGRDRRRDSVTGVGPRSGRAQPLTQAERGRPRSAAMRTPQRPPAGVPCVNRWVVGLVGGGFAGRRCWAGVVGGAGGPAFPDDAEPGAGEDPDGVGVVRGRGRGLVGRGGRPRGWPWRVSPAKSQTASRSCLSTAQRNATIRVLPGLRGSTG